MTERRDGRSVRLLSELMAVDSVNPAFPGGRPEAELARWVAAWCAEIGLQTELDEALPGRPNVMARLAAGEGRGLLLFEAHLDTVSFGVESMRTPQVRGDRLYGRGSCDTKGSLAAMLLALERLARRRTELAIDVMLLCTVDEERAGAGVAHFVTRGIRADGAVVGEPTSLRTVVAHKGCVRFRLTTRGRAGHSSDPDRLESAIYAMADLLGHLRSEVFPRARTRSHPLVGAPTWSVGTIQGGVAVNIVPDRCVIEVDYRRIPGETAEQVLAEVDQALDVFLASRPGLVVERESPFVVSQPLDTSTSAAVVRAATLAQARTGGSSALHGVAYGSDASTLALVAGIPSVVIGPGDIASAHGPEEYVELAQLERAIDLYEAIALAFDPSQTPAQEDRR
ncbi:MAG TPA: M20 family metallopeptidase [Candidatus Limnocylindria bacterium]|nr:M20 family metallopeptidase [Candidatus Limnocylindria bacterium]